MPSLTSAAHDPREAVDAALRRLAETEPDIRAWTLVDAKGARKAAEGITNGPLRGVPVGVKDIIDVAGLPTECGSPLRRGRIATSDAWLVDRLRRAGAVPLGKTVTTEFAYFQPGPTRNPHNLAHTPGGSSSGSAAAVAAGVVPLALGSQTAGSLTRPAVLLRCRRVRSPGRRLVDAGVHRTQPEPGRAGVDHGRGHRTGRRGRGSRRHQGRTPGRDQGVGLARHRTGRHRPGDARRAGPNRQGPDGNAAPRRTTLAARSGHPNSPKPTPPSWRTRPRVPWPPRRSTRSR